VVGEENKKYTTLKAKIEDISCCDNALHIGVAFFHIEMSVIFIVYTHSAPSYDHAPCLPYQLSTLSLAIGNENL
jgi:hypothetical protein